MKTLNWIRPSHGNEELGNPLKKKKSHLWLVISLLKTVILYMFSIKENPGLFWDPHFKMPLLYHTNDEEQILIIELCFRKDIMGCYYCLSFQAEKWLLHIIATPLWFLYAFPFAAVVGKLLASQEDHLPWHCCMVAFTSKSIHWEFLFRWAAMSSSAVECSALILVALGLKRSFSSSFFQRPWSNQFP